MCMYMDDLAARQHIGSLQSVRVVNLSSILGGIARTQNVHAGEPFICSIIRRA